MYVIKRITVDDKFYKSSIITNHTSKKISAALLLLENCVRNFIKEEFGTKASEQFKIIDIHKIEQICEPIIDCVLLYRLSDDPHRIHVYQRKTEIINHNGWFTTSQIPQTRFRRTHIFELEEYLGFTDDKQNILCNTQQNEMVLISQSNTEIPKSMTVAPYRDLIDELKKSVNFKTRFLAFETSHIDQQSETNINNNVKGGNHDGPAEIIEINDQKDYNPIATSMQEPFYAASKISIPNNQIASSIPEPFYAASKISIPNNQIATSTQEPFYAASKISITNNQIALTEELHVMDDNSVVIITDPEHNNINGDDDSIHFINKDGKEIIIDLSDDNSEEIATTNEEHNDSTRFINVYDEEIATTNEEHNDSTRFINVDDEEIVIDLSDNALLEECINLP